MSISNLEKALKQKHKSESKISSSPDLNKLVNAEMEFCRVAKNGNIELSTFCSYDKRYTESYFLSLSPNKTDSSNLRRSRAMEKFPIKFLERK